MSPANRLLVILSNLDIDKYDQGDCHLFAIACHLVLNYRIEALWDIIKGKPYLVHMYCVDKDDQPFDILGITNDDKIKGHADYIRNPIKKKHTMGQVFDLINKGVLNKPQKGEIEKLQEYIKNNKQKYID